MGRKKSGAFANKARGRASTKISSPRQLKNESPEQSLPEANKSPEELLQVKIVSPEELLEVKKETPEELLHEKNESPGELLQEENNSPGKLLQEKNESPGESLPKILPGGMSLRKSDIKKIYAPKKRAPRKPKVPRTGPRMKYTAGRGPCLTTKPKAKPPFPCFLMGSYHGDKMEENYSDDEMDENNSEDEIKENNSGDEIDENNSGDEIKENNSGDEFEEFNSGDEYEELNFEDESEENNSGDEIGEELNFGDKIEENNSGDEIEENNSGDEIEESYSGDKKRLNNSGRMVVQSYPGNIDKEQRDEKVIDSRKVFLNGSSGNFLTLTRKMSYTREGFQHHIGFTYNDDLAKMTCPLPTYRQVLENINGVQVLSEEEIEEEIPLSQFPADEQMLIFSQLYKAAIQHFY